MGNSFCRRRIVSILVKRRRNDIADDMSKGSFKSGALGISFRRRLRNTKSEKRLSSETSSLFDPEKDTKYLCFGSAISDQQ